MSEYQKTPETGLDAPSGEEHAVATLLRDAGPRPAVPPADLAVLKAAARAEWQGLIEERGARTRFGALMPLALAASLVLAVALAWWFVQRPPLAGASIASVELVAGAVGLEPAAAAGELAAGLELGAGAELNTAGPDENGRAPRLALRLSGGHSVRLDAHTRARLASANRLELERGAVYVDSGGGLPAGAGLEIATPFGSVQEIGTQFEVRINEAADVDLRVRVREGEVALERGGESHAAAAGEELILRRDGSVVRSAVEPDAPGWDWVLASAPSVDIEGLPLASYLAWLSRETGWRVTYDDPALQASARRIRLHGTIAGLRPDESVSPVLDGSGLGYRMEGRTLLVTAGPSG